MNTRAPIVALLLINLAAVACSEDEIMTATPPPPARRAVAVTSASATASAAATVGLGEGDFTRTDVNRDPFYSYVDIAGPKPDATRQITTLANNFALDELKLVGIITGNAAPRAMFVDPEGKGWIVNVGQLLGRAEVVKSGTGVGAEYELSWKVDRIRNNDVVFIRETPGRPNVPSATRVITLRSEDPNASRRR